MKKVILSKMALLPEEIRYFTKYIRDRLNVIKSFESPDEKSLVIHNEYAKKNTIDLMTFCINNEKFMKNYLDYTKKVVDKAIVLTEQFSRKIDVKINIISINKMLVDICNQIIRKYKNLVYLEDIILEY